MNRFRDYSGAKRSAIHCAWHPDGGRALVVAHANLGFQSDATVSECYTWNVENSNKPEAILRPPSMALCLEYNPKDSHVILGGLHSGQVSFGCFTEKYCSCELVILSYHESANCSVFFMGTNLYFRCSSRLVIVTVFL